jgi:dienelactone hydrolase
VWGIGKNPYSVPIKSQVIDVASLVNALNDFPALDINNWGITGHSRGGRVTLSLSHKQRWKYIVEEFPSLKTLYPRVGVATSPLCIAPKESDLVVQSLHIISTEKDDQHYSECKNLVDQRKNQNPNINVSFELYEGLNHDFSSDAGEYLGAAFRIKNECFPLYEVNKDFLGGEIAGIVMSEQEASRKCIKRGAYIGGNYAKWEQSRIRVLEVASSILSHRR